MALWPFTPRPTREEWILGSWFALTVGLLCVAAGIIALLLDFRGYAPFAARVMAGGLGFLIFAAIIYAAYRFAAWTMDD